MAGEPRSNLDPPDPGQPLKHPERTAKKSRIDEDEVMATVDAPGTQPPVPNSGSNTHPVEDSGRTAKKSRVDEDELMYPAADELVSVEDVGTAAATVDAAGPQPPVPESGDSHRQSQPYSSLWSFRDAVSQPRDAWDLEDEVEYEDSDIVFVENETVMGIELLETFKTRLDRQWENSVIVNGRRIVCMLCVMDLGRAVVWVRFPDLNPSWYHRSILAAMGSLVGRTVRIDIKTQMVERGQYAKVAVEVDLTKPLTGKIMFEHQEYTVAYEGLHHVCYICGYASHTTEMCSTVVSSAPVTDQQTPTMVAHSTASSSKTVTQPKQFGEWMIAPKTTSRWSKRMSATNGQQVGHKTDKKPHPPWRAMETTPQRLVSSVQGSRFSALMEEEMTEQIVTEQGITTSTPTEAGTSNKGKAVASLEPMSVDVIFPVLARPMPKTRLVPVVEKIKKPSKAKKKEGRVASETRGFWDVGSEAGESGDFYLGGA
ncbi:hypothetical protein Tsubulata_011261 [Turnera subulata]|uniref:DUF4283 domain-containing protein n=1 Tax=Turnera subulata TaxID=218843 RepID=A0A9Q0FWG5_9ROSI|nr:hypothetical protein Tsubulata_011261 [Turnera subulata]